MPLAHAASGAACRMRLSGLCRVRPPSLEPATILKYGVATWGNTAEEAVTHSDEAMHIVIAEIVEDHELIPGDVQLSKELLVSVTV